MNDDNSGTGHALGTGEKTTSNHHLTKEEMREQRLKRLSGGGDGVAAEEEAQLQRALALSLGSPMDIDDDRKPAAVASVPVTTAAPGGVYSPVPFNHDLSREVRTWWENGKPLRDLAAVHQQVLWDASSTTREDQQRWVSQPIQFKERDEAATARHPFLFIVQQHGGPCGVLAAVQAELLRILIFGDTNGAHPIGEIPWHVPRNAEEQTRRLSPLTPLMMQQALALTMGVILARAAVMPSATQNQSNDSTTETVHVALPKHELWNSTHSVTLEWKHFEPWVASSERGTSSHLVTHSISVPRSPADHDTNASAKRQKRSDEEHGDDEEMRDDTFHDMSRLAHAVAQFVLETNAIQWFQRPGGVLLFVLSLALSRNPETLKQEMDDTSSRFTSQFGHCSQELLNLLLTGQAGNEDYVNCRGMGPKSTPLASFSR
jgi:hypothetical protein